MLIFSCWEELKWKNPLLNEKENIPENSWKCDWMTQNPGVNGQNQARRKKLLSPEPLNQTHEKNECVDGVNEPSEMNKLCSALQKQPLVFHSLQHDLWFLFRRWHHFLSFLASFVLLATMNPCCHDITAPK